MTIGRFLLVASLAFAAVPRSADAFTPAEALCRKTLASNVFKIATTIVKASTKCHRARMTGDPAVANTDCNDVTQLPQNLLAKILKAEAQLTILADTKCAVFGYTPEDLGYVTCTAPCDAIDIQAFSGPSGVSACLACQTRAHIGLAGASTYGTYPDPPILDPSSFAHHCQQAIGKQLVRLQQTRMKEQQKCQGLKDNGKPPTTGATNCRTADLKGKVAK